MIIAITGSIACGRSTVTNYLLKKGYKVIDADKIAHDIILYPEVKKYIKKEFSEEVFEKEEISRVKLGNIVFNNKEKLNKLNSILHPMIRKEILKKISKSENITFLDIPLLFEAKFDDLADFILVVYTDKLKQIDRLMKRNNITYVEAIKRIDKQYSSEYKKKLANFVIDNNGTRENTEKQVDNLLLELNKIRKGKNCVKH